jgi:hypothetical protein
VVEIVFDDDGTLIPLVLDAAPEEIHRAASIATEVEVERGVSVADHVRPERRMLQLNVVISDTPIAPTSDLSGDVRAKDIEMPGRRVHTRGARQSGPTSFEAAESEERAAPSTRVQIYQPDSTPTRVQDSWAIVLDAMNRALLATVSTGLESYSNQVLIEAQVTRTAQDGTWIRAQLTFVQIRMVATELVSDPTPARARDRRQDDRGSQATTEAEPQLQSLALRGLTFAGVSP